MNTDGPTIECELRFLRTEDGGRVGSVSLSGNIYRPHLVAADSDYLGVTFDNGPPSVAPGERATATALLLYPKVDYSPLQSGVNFSIMEGPKIVGHGTVVRRLVRPAIVAAHKAKQADENSSDMRPVCIHCGQRFEITAGRATDEVAVCDVCLGD